jgi:N-acetylneuraminic acid mutarotase
MSNSIHQQNRHLAPGRRRSRSLVSATSTVSFSGLEPRRLMASPSVTGLTLINAATDLTVGSIANGATINVDLKNTRSLNFRADTSSATSVRFGYDGNTNFRTEGSAPFAFAGNNGNDYAAFTPTVGTHTVHVRAYAGANGSSTASSEYKVTIKVVDTTGVNQTPAEGGQSPYPGSAPSLPSQTVLFDNFDNGGEGVAYHDASSTNETGQYRTNVGVDIEPTTDSAPGDLQSQSGIGRNIGHVRAGEWLEYTVSIPTAGTYKLGLRFASANNGGIGHLEVDGNNVTGPITLGNTGGWQTWKTIEKSGVVLPAGTHVLKFVIDSTNSGTDIGNLHWFRFTTESVTGNPPPTPGQLTWPTNWQKTNDAPSTRYEAMGHSFGGKLYVFGGFKDSAFRVDRTYTVYNPSNNTWTSLGTLPVGMSETHVTPADDGKYIYFVGGFKGDLRHDGVTPSQQGSARVWRYEPGNNSWTELTQATLPRIQGASATAIVGRKLYMISGDHEDRVTATADSLVLNLDNLAAGWTSIKNHPDPKDHMSTIVLSGKIYTLGGEYGHDQLGDTQKSVHVYDPATNNWTRLADMPFRSGHAEGSTFVMNGNIIFAGGQTTGQGATNRVAAYNPATNSWTELKALPRPLQGTIVQAFGNKVIVTLGAQWTEQPLKETWIGYI